MQSTLCPLHAPQCLSSLVRSTQVPAQFVLPAAQQRLPEQVPLQAGAVQLPQCLASEVRSTQVPLQFVMFAAQQMPDWQEPLHEAWPERGEPLIGPQVPGVAPLQASQVPLQAVLQQ